MKKLKVLFFTLILICLSIFAFGQIERGTSLIGGSSKLSLDFINADLINNDDNEDQFNFEFSPQYAKFFAKNLALGIEIPFNRFSATHENNSKTKLTTLAFAPFFRLYSNNNNIRAYFQTGVGFGYAAYKTVISTLINANTGSILLYKLGLGFDIPINEVVSFDLGIDYNHTAFNLSDDKDIVENFSLHLGFVFFLKNNMDN
jgi:hypothetical protein